jgi:alanine racemase
MRITRPAYIKIDLDCIAHNISQVKNNVSPGTIITAVIKADGYGHGAKEIGQTLIDNGANRFAVATLSEGIALRKFFKDIPILVMGYTPTEDLKKAFENNLYMTIYSIEQAKYISGLNIKNKVHIKIDTGMGRIGLRIDEESKDELLEICKTPNLDIEGIFSHFSTADEYDKEYTKEQARKFFDVLSFLEKHGINIPIKHISNSAAIIDHPEYNLNMVRAGIMIYGLYPSDQVDHNKIKLKQAMSLVVGLSHVKKIDKGDSVSYGRKFKATEETVIGSLPLGYADGITRLLYDKLKVNYKGQNYPVVGRICMDQCMVNFGLTEPNVGEEVEIFGQNITIDEVAKTLGTINYEIVCMMGKRLPRVYYKNGEPILVKDMVMGDRFEYEY